MSLLLVLLACQRDDPGAAEGAPVPIPPGVTLQAPAAGAFLPPGATEVLGQAPHVEAVSVDGVAAEVIADVFSASVALPVGISTLTAEGADADGVVHQDRRSVLAGDFAEPSGAVPAALQLHLGTATLDALTAGAGGLLDPAALSAQLTALNPIVDSPEAIVSLTGIDFGEPQLQLVPTDGALQIQILVPDFVIGIDATIVDALPFGIDLDLSPDLTGAALQLDTALALAPDGQGGLSVTIAELQAEIVDFDLDTGLLELIDWLFLDDDDLAELLEDQLAGLGATLQPTIDEALAGLQLDQQLEILERTLSISPSFDRATIDPAGISLSLGVALDVDALSPAVPGFLSFAPPEPLPGDAITVQVSDAFMNRALFELWSGGALDLELPLGAEDVAILFLFGGADAGHLSLSAQLPPVWLQGPDGSARLQLGEARMIVETPGGRYGEVVDLILALDAAAELSLTPGAASVILSDATVRMRTAGDSVGHEQLEPYVSTLETSFGVGIGVINELLSFPAAELLGEGAALPELALQRDPSGRGTLLQLSTDQLLSLLGSTDTAGTGSTTASTPSAAQIPAGAEVHDDDADVASDGGVHWVCPGQRVEVTGSGGTWYVEDSGDLRIEGGTGHTILAIDGAEVRLETAGNTVSADPGADIDDRDGGNTIQIVDPLSFDRSSAPTPGC